tara:strand:+ start:683 stop:889 length:207 start_codon:yes stop_codon:yes gene_type:complete
MSLLMSKFLEDKIKIYEYNVKDYEFKLLGLDYNDSMYEFYSERYAESKLWLDVLYTARDAKADNPYSK